MHSARLATEAGFGGAMLLRRGGLSEDRDGGAAGLEKLAVLDGPNFGIAWFKVRAIARAGAH